MYAVTYIKNTFFHFFFSFFYFYLFTAICSIDSSRGGSKSLTCKSISKSQVLTFKSQVTVMKIKQVRSLLLLKQVKSSHGYGQASHKKFV